MHTVISSPQHFSITLTNNQLEFTLISYFKIMTSQAWSQALYKNCRAKDNDWYIKLNIWGKWDSQKQTPSFENLETLQYNTAVKNQ